MLQLGKVLGASLQKQKADAMTGVLKYCRLHGAPHSVPGPCSHHPFLASSWEALSWHHPRKIERERVLAAQQPLSTALRSSPVETLPECSECR